MLHHCIFFHVVCYDENASGISMIWNKTVYDKYTFKHNHLVYSYTPYLLD